ncbi:hypothetical protein [Caenimonas sp. SL110]|uniref:hypothetical protein n=1 Tax=Caenimonas sp. SL110 TaxID=1450524 RepID=UPI00069FE967|nr:hypothetical protein [Caenimonas sp. SL110]
MSHAAAFETTGWASTHPASIDSSDEFEMPGEAPYCPMGLLATFVELMAEHGRAISNTSMLGDREYAMWQLARAHAMGNSELRAVAVRLFAYFDDLNQAARTAH